MENEAGGRKISTPGTSGGRAVAGGHDVVIIKKQANYMNARAELVTDEGVGRALAAGASS